VLKYEKPLPNSGLNFNLRRYSTERVLSTQQFTREAKIVLQRAGRMASSADAGEGAGAEPAWQPAQLPSPLATGTGAGEDLPRQGGAGQPQVHHLKFQCLKLIHE